MSSNLFNSQDINTSMPMPTVNDTQEQSQTPKNINITECVQTLINGVQIAQKRGAYNLKEASVISNAIDFIAESFNKQK